jgi:hypothetical protein
VKEGATTTNQQSNTNTNTALIGSNSNPSSGNTLNVPSKGSGGGGDGSSSSNAKEMTQVSSSTGGNQSNAINANPTPSSGVNVLSAPLLTVTVVKVTPQTLGGGSGACMQEETRDGASAMTAKTEKKKKFKVCFRSELHSCIFFFF